MVHQGDTFRAAPDFGCVCYREGAGIDGAATGVQHWPPGERLGACYLPCLSAATSERSTAMCRGCDEHAARPDESSASSVWSRPKTIPARLLGEDCHRQTRRGQPQDVTGVATSCRPFWNRRYNRLGSRSSGYGFSSVIERMRATLSACFRLLVNGHTR